MIKERPILFSAPMVRAILDGRKNMTRRVVKERHLPFVVGMLNKFIGGDWDKRPLPYGKPGEHLWVREQWAVSGIYDSIAPSKINPGGKPNWCGIYYAASKKGIGLKERPSIFMPRWASRILLEVTDIRVERLQDITEEDAKAEGWNRLDWVSKDPEVHRDAARDWFMDLWDGINGNGAWKSNPLVWVISFRRIDQAEARDAA